MVVVEVFNTVEAFSKQLTVSSAAELKHEVWHSRHFGPGSLEDENQKIVTAGSTVREGSKLSWWPPKPGAVQQPASNEELLAKVVNAIQEEGRATRDAIREEGRATRAAQNAVEVTASECNTKDWSDISLKLSAKFPIRYAEQPPCCLGSLEPSTASSSIVWEPDNDENAKANVERMVSHLQAEICPPGTRVLAPCRAVEEASSGRSKDGGGPPGPGPSSSAQPEGGTKPAPQGPRGAPGKTAAQQKPPWGRNQPSHGSKGRHQTQAQPLLARLGFVNASALACEQVGEAGAWEDEAADLREPWQEQLSAQRLLQALQMPGMCEDLGLPSIPSTFRPLTKAVYAQSFRPMVPDGHGGWNPGRVPP